MTHYNERLFIGDIHGQAHKLEALLSEIYIDLESTQLVFVGDLVDNRKGSRIDHIKLLNTIKTLVDDGKALCIMGNHEFNAIGWALQKSDGSYCRDRLKAGNIKQHECFIEQVGEDSAEHQKWIAWFKKLPLFLDFGSIRTIHACWHQESIDKLRPYLNQDNSLKEQHWFDAFDKQHELYHLIETLLKDPEISLPAGYSFKDKSGIERHNIRVAWWKDPKSIPSYQDLAVVAEEQKANIPQIPVEPSAFSFNQTLDVPVVVGHYSFTGDLKPQSEMVACVDYNAQKEEYPLVGYLWSKPTSTQNSLSLSEDRFCYQGITSFLDTTYGQITDAFYDAQYKKINNMPELQLKPEEPAEGASNEAAEQHIEKHEIAYERVDEYLFTEWDPIGINGMECCRDEYQYYTYRVTCFALFGSVHDLAFCLWGTMVLLMGLGRGSMEKQNKIKKDCIEHAQRLKQLVGE